MVLKVFIILFFGLLTQSGHSMVPDEPITIVTPESVCAGITNEMGKMNSQLISSSQFIDRLTPYFLPAVSPSKRTRVQPSLQLIIGSAAHKNLPFIRTTIPIDNKKPERILIKNPKPEEAANHLGELFQELKVFPSIRVVEFNGKEEIETFFNEVSKSKVRELHSGPKVLFEAPVFDRSTPYFDMGLRKMVTLPPLRSSGHNLLRTIALYFGTPTLVAATLYGIAAIIKSSDSIASKNLKEFAPMFTLGTAYMVIVCHSMLQSPKKIMDYSHDEESGDFTLAALKPEYGFEVFESETNQEVFSPLPRQHEEYKQGNRLISYLSLRGEDDSMVVLLSERTLMKPKLTVFHLTKAK